MAGMGTDWRLVALLYAAGLLAAAQFAKVALTLDGLALAYPSVGGALPFTVSALSVVGMIFGATAGALIARLGARPALVGGLVVAGLLSLAQGLLPPFPMLLGLRFLEGAAHLALVVAAPTLMAGVAAARHQPGVMGLWGTFFGVGFALTALLVPPLVGAGGVGAVFAVHGLAMLVLAVPLRALLPSVPGETAVRESWRRRHAAIYLSPRIVAPATGFLWHTLIFLGVLTYLPAFLGDWTAPILPLLALVGTMAAGLMARHVPTRRLFVFAYGASVAGAAALALAPPALLVPLGFVFLVLLGVAPGASFAAVTELNATSADRARANGAIAQLGNVGTALSVPLMAATLPLGLVGPLAATAALSLLGLVAVLLVYRAMAGATPAARA